MSRCPSRNGSSLGRLTRTSPLGEGDACVAIDRDVVVVVDPAEIVETKVTGQRGRLRLRLSFSEIPAPLHGRLIEGRTCEFYDLF
jgi:hypothetical protein